MANDAQLSSPPGPDAQPHQALIAPRAPHDALDFFQLSQRYNFRKTSDRRGVFVRLIRNEIARCARPVRVLDIGCGTGIGDEVAPGALYLSAIQEACQELWGVEPDPGVEAEHGLFHQFQHATLEAADLPENYFDLAFSFFVMEHVDDPRRFMERVYRCLKPGGVYLFLTPNGRHYFTRIASALHALRLDEWVLRKTVGEYVDHYHYPVRYRFNFESQVRRISQAAGFSDPHFAYLEADGPRPYFRGPTIALFHLLCLKRQLIRSRRSLLEMVGRIEKPPAKAANRDAGPSFK